MLTQAEKGLAFGEEEFILHHCPFSRHLLTNLNAHVTFWYWG